MPYVIKLESDVWIERFKAMDTNDKDTNLKLIVDFMTVHPNACNNLQLITYKMDDNEMFRDTEYSFDYTDPLSYTGEVLVIDVNEDVDIPACDDSVYMMAFMDSQFNIHIIAFSLELCRNDYYPGDVNDCRGYKCRRTKTTNMDYYCTACHGDLNDNDFMINACRRHNESGYMKTTTFLGRANSYLAVSFFPNVSSVIYSDATVYVKMFLEWQAGIKADQQALDNRTKSLVKQMYNFTVAKKLVDEKVELKNADDFTLIFQKIIDDKKLADEECKRVADEKKRIDEEQQRADNERKRIEDENYRKQQERLINEFELAKIQEEENILLQKLATIQKAKDVKVAFLASVV